LVVTDKAERVKHYAANINWEVGVIAHSCGVTEPRRLRRKHAHVISNNGLSIPLSQLHPEPENAH
jgi:glutamate synthase domain-containing protein 2